MKNILVATDGSEAADKAIDLAAELAGAEAARLTIVNVVENWRVEDQTARYGEVELGEAARGAALPPNVVDLYAGLTLTDALKVFSGQSALLRQAVSDNILAAASERARKAGARDVDTLSVSGDAAREIVNAARDTRAELIVMGRRGLNSLAELLLGSVSRKVLHRAGTNVLTVV